MRSSGAKMRNAVLRRLILVTGDPAAVPHRVLQDALLHQLADGVLPPGRRLPGALEHVGLVDRYDGFAGRVVGVLRDDDQIAALASGQTEVFPVVKDFNDQADSHQLPASPRPPGTAR